MKSLRNLALLLATTLPFTLGGCASDNTSSTAQLIECTAGASGPEACHPVAADDHAAGTCVDRDEDDDGEAHDADDSGDDSAATGDLDDDDDGTADSEDADDDNDGVDDDRDCDELPGQDDDDSGDGA